MISGKEEFLSCQGVKIGKAVGLGVSVIVDVDVIVGLGVHEGVSEGVKDGVMEGVNVCDGVSVTGWNGVEVKVGVVVLVDVEVNVGVLVTVPVTINGVRLMVGVAGVLRVGIAPVIVGVRSAALGASVIAIQPMQ